MVNDSIINPSSIAIIGASNNSAKPGGKIVRNILAGKYGKPLYSINPHEKSIQGTETYPTLDTIKEVDLAILVVSPKACLEYARILLTEKSTRALIILSAGFGELDEEGKEIEKAIVDLANKYNACLIGPNCIGVLSPHYQGVFTTPIPILAPNGCDLISSSGATAVFLMESSIPNGLKFANVFSVGNAAQTTIADILEYLDNNHDPNSSAPIKLLYFENIVNPQKLLKHAKSLINKGCKIAAIKAGSTIEGSRAASSHTGAIANPDIAVKALFRKAGIVLCQSRQELIAVASVLHYKELCGRNIAIITHAGGSAVMLTDTLSLGGFNIPQLKGHDADELKSHLNKGSSVQNPIDFLATGTAEQLGIIIDYCEHKFHQVDAMVVVFGSPGLFDVENVYRVLSVKLDICRKPIFPVLPSVLNAQKEISYFISKGHVNFPDEVILGNALSNVIQTQKPISTFSVFPEEVDNGIVREIIDRCSDGFLPVEETCSLLLSAGIPAAKQQLINSIQEIETVDITFPWVMKVSGLLHKSDSGGVMLNISSRSMACEVYEKLTDIQLGSRVIIQEQHAGHELFVGVKFEPRFGHLILFGLGGIFIEILEDFQFTIAPANKEEIRNLLRKLKGYKLFTGLRGKHPIDENAFIGIVLSISRLIKFAPEIVEMDLNPLIAEGETIVAVDARIRIQKHI